MKFTLLEGKTRRAKTKVDIKMKDGSSLPAGTSGTLRPLRPEETAKPDRRYTMGIVFTPDGEEKGYRLAIQNIDRYFEGFRRPSMKTLQRWTYDYANPKTPVGTEVEPDGVDPDGWPSWMLILGML